ncbi:M61 family metallopeptidase [Mesoterricola sediminis]|uniref:Peptidase M61 n=1 Tax=Mesoterricola sediminis TaxID=2927980 RepID=A0AA48KD46_9BACT|nr:PDZ domain-containing protein [Mesoterricola sediminis]BDU76700.1 peptidase M61 [Mesoterricola sediminis]
MPPRSTPPAPVTAVLRPLSLSMHELEVELTFPPEAVAKPTVAALPAWTPGSYLVRDYARFLDRLRVEDGEGRPLAAEKLDKQRWRLPASPGGLRVTYRLFCNELTVRTNHMDAAHAHLVGAATFLYLEGQTSRPWEVRFEGWPKAWRVATALPRRERGYAAQDHDTLVDSPFELGTFRTHGFRVRGCEFQVAITGAHPGDENRIVEGTEAIVAACARIFGGFPFKRYLFLLTFSPKARGGLEHRDSTSLLADPHQLERAEGYWDLFLLIAHEFFHVWNVKRLRDAALGPFDYGSETYTRLLWFHEGFTSFMQFAIALRAGVVPWPWVARKLSASWTDNTTRPGRHEQDLEASSFDAWIRHYKPTEFSTNGTVSYYDKGSMVGWMMDAEIRLASGGASGLDALFALLWARNGDGHLSDADIRAAYRELAGKDPGPFWSRWIQGCAELDAEAISRAYGLTFTVRSPWEALPAGEAGDPDAQRRARTWAGLAFQGASPSVQNVLPGSPAARAGLGYGMEILAVDGWRTATAQEVQGRIGDFAPGDRVRVLATDRGRVEAYDLILSESPHRTTSIGADPRAGAAQRAAFEAWTGQPFPGKRP